MYSIQCAVPTVGCRFILLQCDGVLISCNCLFCLCIREQENVLCLLISFGWFAHQIACVPVKCQSSVQPSSSFSLQDRESRGRGWAAVVYYVRTVCVYVCMDKCIYFFICALVQPSVKIPTRAAAHVAYTYSISTIVMENSQLPSRSHHMLSINCIQTAFLTHWISLVQSK